MANWDKIVPDATEKQMDLIRSMESYGCPEFKGKSIKEASEYIEENYEYFKEQKRFMK